MNHVGWNNQVGDRNDTAYGGVEVQGKSKSILIKEIKYTDIKVDRALKEN